MNLLFKFKNTSFTLMSIALLYLYLLQRVNWRFYMDCINTSNFNDLCNNYNVNYDVLPLGSIIGLAVNYLLIPYNYQKSKFDSQVIFLLSFYWHYLIFLIILF